MSTTDVLLVYDYQCPKCHKKHQLTAKNGYIGSKEIETIRCRCGNDVSVIILHYLQRKIGFIGDRKYIIS